MLKFSLNKYCVLYLLFAPFFFLTPTEPTYAADKKFFTMNKMKSNAASFKKTQHSPFKHLRNYRSPSRKFSGKANFNKSFTKDRDSRRLLEFNTVDTPNERNILDDVLWPIPPHIKQRISSPFGYRIHPVTGKRAFHKGIDIAAARGTPVRATHDGIVTAVKRHRYLGKYVKVKHSSNEYALYGHLSAWNVSVGDRVTSGEILGKVGSTGRSTGPHLDYSLRRNGKPINPLSVLKPPSANASMRLSLLK